MLWFERNFYTFCSDCFCFFLAASITLVQAQQWQEAVAVAQSINNESSKANTLGTIALALAQAQQWQEAAKIARSIEDGSSKANTLGKIAQTLLQAQKREKSRIIAQEAVKVILLIHDEYSRADTLGTIIQTLIQIQQWDEAVKIAQSFGNPNLQAKTVRKFVGILIQVQQWEEAVKITRLIEGIGLKTEALREIIQALIQIQRWEEARTTAQEAVSVVRSIEDTVQTLKKLAQVLVPAELWDINLIQWAWLSAETREQAMQVFLLISDVIVRNVFLEKGFVNAFTWVDAFLKVLALNKD